MKRYLIEAQLIVEGPQQGFEPVSLCPRDTEYPWSRKFYFDTPEAARVRIAQFSKTHPGLEYHILEVTEVA